MRTVLVILLGCCLLSSCLAEQQLQQLQQQQQQQVVQQPTGNVIDEPSDEDAPSRDHENRLDEVDQRGLPIYTTLNGSVTNLNEILSTIHLNRTEATLNCSQGSMQVDLQFQEAFYGLAYADFDRNSACMTKGRGLDTAKIELPLKGCGTIQGPPRVFTNNIVVRFHPFLEMDGDEVITIVCRYPPAISKVEPAIPDQRIGLPPSPPLLSATHMLLMICTLLFLTLLLLGLGCSYMCLKGRPVSVIHRTIASSEITKISGSTEGLSHRSLFDDFKIPRIGGTHQAYGSETHLVEHSDTLPSDYPSESHSEVDEERSLPVSSAGSYETKAFVHPQVEQRASSSLYSETINEIESTAVTASRVVGHQSRHGVAMHLEPKFDVQMRVKQAPAPPSPLPSESEASVALERNLTTILEREESSRTTTDAPPPNRLTSFAYVPELHAPPSTSRQQTPPVYSRILRKQAERESFDLDTERTETRSLTEVTDATHAKYRVASMLAPSSPPGSTHRHHHHHQLVTEEQETREETVEPLVEPVVSPRRPEITTHEVDDVFLRTVTEKKTIEDIERHRRQVTEYHARHKPLPPDPKWDVTIRNYPTKAHELAPTPPDWENFSDVSSASNLTVTLEPATTAANQHQPTTSQHPATDVPIDVHIQPTYTRARGSEQTERCCNLERLLEPQYAAEFTEAERKKWREIITTESTLRSLLTEATVREDYELVRRDSRYAGLFPPAKWDVIIRILGAPGPGGSVPSSGSSTARTPTNGTGQRYKRAKSTEWDNRSRRSSLPTLYEYESDGGSSARTFTRLATAGPGGILPGTRIRRLSSTTRGGSEADLRSMSEMTVRDFARLDRDDQTSLSSYDGDSMVRSLSQPSLARSGSEFTEHWGLPARNLPHWGADDDEDEEMGEEQACSSTETTPRPVRRRELLRQHESTTGGQPTASATGFVRSSRYSEMRLQQQQTSSAKRPGWFHDDSEPEMQI
ncbi:uncharacterized protein LOC106644365 [Copidosoma floridanum]|uniref:uncharacterized protein LOC106644365 n=1 Tax=Copidosoma floridanum TaxID=29053 RepID=UPI0006C94F95|nr:uncharacterized protein LOC106644365 [Copidosoma floridanum]